MTSINPLWLVSGLALLLSIFAVLAACLSWVQSRSSSSGKLSQRLSEAESLIEMLSADFKNMRAARNMQARREQVKSRESSGLTAAESDDGDATRRELNRRLATGELKPRGIP